jgi:hypothetical protein
VTVSLAAFVLTCFFLPWLQVSCLGLRDSASGFDLAQEGNRALWLVPLAMLLVLLMGLTRFIWESAPALFGMTSMVSGGLAAYLIYREHSRTIRWEGLIDARWTIWFWLGIIASLGVAASALVFYIRRSRAP